MKLKKIISITLAAIMSLLLLSTTVMAATYNKYYLAYEYSGQGNEMKWVVKGSSEKVRTKAINPTSYSRYVSVAVTKRKRDGGAYISSKGDDNTGKQMWANTAMARSLSNTDIYYVHSAVLKPSASNSYTIDSITYNIYQLPSY